MESIIDDTGEIIAQPTLIEMGSDDDWFSAFESVLGEPAESYDAWDDLFEVWLLGPDQSERVVLRSKQDVYWIGCFFDHSDGNFSVIFQSDVDEIQVGDENIRAKNSLSGTYVSISRSGRGNITHSGMHYVRPK